MNQPIFVHLDPESSCVYLPDITGLPAHLNKETNTFDVIKEHGLQLWLGTPGDSGGGGHTVPVEAPLRDGFSVCRCGRMSESPRSNSSSGVSNGSFPFLEVREVVGIHTSPGYEESPICRGEKSVTPTRRSGAAPKARRRFRPAGIHGNEASHTERNDPMPRAPPRSRLLCWVGPLR
jgi:hypothetical protein